MWEWSPDPRTVPRLQQLGLWTPPTHGLLRGRFWPSGAAPTPRGPEESVLHCSSSMSLSQTGPRRSADEQVGSVLVQSHGWVTRDRVTRGNGHVNPGIGQKPGSCRGLTLDHSEVHKRSQQLPEIVHRAAMAKGAPQSLPLIQALVEAVAVNSTACGMSTGTFGVPE